MNAGKKVPGYRQDLLILLIFLFAPLTATAGEDVEFGASNKITSSFASADSLFPADLDKDGDDDILCASSTYNSISWFENTAGDYSSWTEHNITNTFMGAMDAIAVDLDQDGDLDIIGAAYDDHDIAWWENTAGDGTAWTEHTVDGTFDGARSVYTADVDGDGDRKIVG